MIGLLIRYSRSFKMEKILPWSSDIKISSKLLDLKPIHARWVVDWHNHVIKEKEMIVRGFNSAGILEVVQNAADIYENIENPLRE